MSRTTKVVISVIVAVTVAVTAIYWYARPLLLTGTGYAAHNACAVDHVAGRQDPDSDLPENPLVPVMRTSTGDAAATASVLGVLAKQTAWALPGYGCTLAGDRPDVLPTATDVTADSNPYASLPLTVGDDADITEALAHGFGDDLDAEAQDALGTRGIVVLKDGELIAERYADGFDESTPQLGWSMTKSVTNLMVGALVQQGELSLDDDQLREEWTDGRQDITIRQLLNMTSGLEWDETYDLGTPITQMLYGEEDMGAYVASQELAHTPGEYLQYSSGSTTLLCDVVTKDRGLANVPRQEIFAPLGLAGATLEADAVGTPVCSSYMWATPREWASIGQFALQDGTWNDQRLLPEGWMTQSTVAIDTEVEEGSDGYALGWWSNTRPDSSVIHDLLPEDTYFASGHDGQRITVVPSQNVVIVRLGFTPAADDNRVDSTSAAILAALN
ncbi:serine hydrolase domain-containing protein [Demequina sediminicola]|uniref:serine hydrolase domain-containing protein n=1 Tax=Demequina sediminicola TaxID=1095026 RepID=UPI0007846768|nr:serine hydrolase [Demequina sediminicola]